MTTKPDDVVTIQISRRTYDRLQDAAVPLMDKVDRVDSLIATLLDRAEVGSRPLTPVQNTMDPDEAPARRRMASGTEVDIKVADAFAPPSLKWAKVLWAQVDGHEVRKNWAGVRLALLQIAIMERGYDLRKLAKVCPINAVDEKKCDEGYHYYPQFGLSIQGQNANDAWLAAASLAQAMRVPVQVRFEWRVKDDAVHPGKLGLLKVDA